MNIKLYKVVTLNEGESMISNLFVNPKLSKAFVELTSEVFSSMALLETA
jgi:hypothetical protein